MGLFSSSSGNRPRSRELVEIVDDDPPAAIEFVDEALGYLDDSENAVRGNAAYVLRVAADEYPDRVTDFPERLVRCLNDPNPVVQKNATTAIGLVAKHAPREAIVAVEPLADRLEDGNDEARQSAAFALEQVAIDYPGEVAWATGKLVDRLEDDSGKVSAEAAGALLAVGRAYPERVARYAQSLADRIDGPGANAGNWMAQTATQFFDGDGQVVQGSGRVDSATRNVSASALAVVAAKRPDAVHRDFQVTAVERLVQWFDDTPENVFDFFGDVMGDTSILVDALVEFLDRPARHLRLGAAGILGGMAEHRPEVVVDAVDPIVAVLDDDDASVRTHAVFALGQVGREYPDVVRDATDRLLARVHDANEQVRTNAVVALGTVAAVDPGAVAPAVDPVLDRLDDPDSGLEATDAAVFLGNVSAASPGDVVEVAHDLADCLEAERDRVRRGATEALANVGQHRPRAVVEVGDALVGRLYDSERPTREAAVRAVAAIARVRPREVTRAADPLADYLDADDGELRAEAALALAKIAPEAPAAVAGAVPELRERFEDDTDEVRERAAGALLAVADHRPEAVDVDADRLREVAGDTYESADSGREDGSTGRDGRSREGSSGGRPSGRESTRGRSGSGSPSADRIPDRIPSGPTTSVDYDAVEQVELLGTGGSADVYRSRVSVDGEQRPLAVKEPRTRGTLHADAVEEFLSEARTWAKLDDSEFVVDVVDWSDRPLPWIAMEYMDGGHLGQRAGDPPLPEALWIARSVTQGVWHAHEHGVAHLDLKPENVLFRETPGDAWPVPKVADWGLSEVLLEHSGSADGLSTRYAAPEQFDADRFGELSVRTDVYALGAVLYELFTGQPPIDASGTAAMYEVIESQPPAPTERDPGLPRELDDVLLRCLAKEQDDRYDSSILLREELDDLFARARDGRL